MEDTQRLTRGLKRAHEEAADEVSTFTNLNSRDFNDLTLTRDDPHHQVGIPKKRRQRARENKEL
ncbi:hypothetical protein K469DRAFT_383320 [Zopfia rhizophila CBS 207.26]|uniref:Uncharacterized protein n=1 Tax=Zopfia rhizophila CBS 207.26 TaxID=1314779 RepID=A0A6A6DCV8_9PEZI|nr:hypothetical protein K469DRAFT_383320 [Zopfia rhizophila CBS 207.26]